MQDLRGKRLPSRGSLETPFLDRFLAAGGLTRGDVELLSVDAAAKTGMFVSGRADGVFSSVPFLTATVRPQRPASAIRFADLGLTFPSFGMVAAERTLREKPATLRRLASVTAGAWAYILAGKRAEAVCRPWSPHGRRRGSTLPCCDEQIDTLCSASCRRRRARVCQPVVRDGAGDWAEAVAQPGRGRADRAGGGAGGYYTNDMLDPALIASVAAGRVG